MRTTVATRRRKRAAAASATLAVLLLFPRSGQGQQLRLRSYASGFSLPVGFVQDPTDPTVHFVVEQGGRIRTTRNGSVLPTDFLDLRAIVGCCGERGLLGFAFAPDYATSRRFFVDYTNMNGDTVVARYTRSIGNPLVADPTSRFDLRWGSIAGAPPYIEHVPEFGNHNGGNLVFGPDSYLYIGMGDGGSGDDPNNRGQSANTLLAKILRIDVSVPDVDVSGYRVPADNPFVDSTPIAALPEIWDFGVRNPWRFSFDVGAGGTGALVIADVGQGRREEVDYEPAASGGRNYGWRVREGTLPNIAGPTAFDPVTDPIYEYDHSVGFSITGGFVYRGTALPPAFRGRYFFADFIVGRIWSMGLRIDPSSGAAAVVDVIEHTDELGGRAVVGSISSFGRDSDGELYIVQYGGTVQKLVSATGTIRFMALADFGADSHPDLLSQTQNGNVTVALNQGAVFETVQRIYDDMSTWRIVGVADLNNDGHNDVIWQGPTGSIVAWLLNTPAGTQPVILFGGTSDWRVVGVADMDRDGSADLIWQSPTGQVVIWFLRGASTLRATTIWASASAWRIVGAADFSGDGSPDLLWQGPAGQLALWSLRGSAVIASQVAFAGASDWTAVGVGDVNGDGKPDVLWQAPSGQMAAWLVSGMTPAGFTFSGTYLNRFGLQWELSATPQ